MLLDGVSRSLNYELSCSCAGSFTNTTKNSSPAPRREVTAQCPLLTTTCPLPRGEQAQAAGAVGQARWKGVATTHHTGQFGAHLPFTWEMSIHWLVPWCPVHSARVWGGLRQVPAPQIILTRLVVLIPQCLQSLWVLWWPQTWGTRALRFNPSTRNSCLKQKHPPVCFSSWLWYVGPQNPSRGWVISSTSCHPCVGAPGPQSWHSRAGQHRPPRGAQHPGLLRGLLGSGAQGFAAAGRVVK